MLVIEEEEAISRRSEGSAHSSKEEEVAEKGSKNPSHCDREEEFVGFFYHQGIKGVLLKQLKLP